jgi:ADP-heptose:LPS heptosyltransferase
VKTEHILIIRFSALGDVAMLVPVVSSLARQYPHLRITVLSRPFARALFEDLAPNVGFMGADLKGEYSGMRGLNALYRRLVAKNFTAIADMHNILRSGWLRMRFNLALYRVEHINKHRQERKQLTAESGKQLHQLPTSFQNYADVLCRLGYPIEMDFTSMFPPAGGNLRLLPETIGEKKAFQQWVGIAPFAAHKGKIYPTDKMEQVVAETIRRHPSCRIFLFGGGKEEHAVLDAWAQRYPNAVNASTLLGSLQQELILMSHLDVMVSMDSANMHLAAICGTRVVSVWGATHPFAGFTGWHQRESDMVQSALPCRPCSIYGAKPCLCGDYACLASINPAQILEKIETVLNEK